MNVLLKVLILTTVLLIVSADYINDHQLYRQEDDQPLDRQEETSDDGTANHDQNNDKNTPDHKEDKEDELYIDDGKGNQHGDKEHGAQSQTQTEYQHLHPSQPQFWYTVLLSCVLTCVGAFCSGMTVGFLSISKLQLEMMAVKKNEEESKMATTILNVISDHHLFLVTLLVYNAIALQSLPIVIHHLMPAWAAILFSTLIVLVGAQIIPQAYCTGIHKITIAYYACPVVLIMKKILYFIIYPIAKGLDYLLGIHHQNERINRKDFKIFLNDDTSLKSSEKLLLTSTLELRGLRVTEAMIDLKKIYMLEESQILKESKMREIQSKDYSFILVYKTKKNNITGFIKTKTFALYCLKQESKKQFKVSQIMNSATNLITVYADTNLLEMLMLFQAKSTRIAFVCNLKKKIDPRIQSIMYSKSDMILSQSNEKQDQIIGVIFLFQIFETMADLKQRIQRKSEMHLGYPAQPMQMNNISESLLKK